MGRTLVLLVGANPLPNYLAARILATERPWESAVLFYRRAFGELGGVEERFVADSGAESIRAAWRGLPAPVHLHSTGGTETMAVHLHPRWPFASGEVPR